MRILSLYYIFKESIYHKICTIYKILTHCSGRDMLLLKRMDFSVLVRLFTTLGDCFLFCRVVAFIFIFVVLRSNLWLSLDYVLIKL
jgi:hypothetical protein